MAKRSSMYRALARLLDERLAHIMLGERTSCMRDLSRGCQGSKYGSKRSSDRAPTARLVMNYPTVLRASLATYNLNQTVNVRRRRVLRSIQLGDKWSAMHIIHSGMRSAKPLHGSTNTEELQIWETYKRLAESQWYSEMSRGEYCLFVTACGAVIVGVGCKRRACTSNSK